MIKILVKKQLAEIFRSYFYNPKKNKARSKAAVIAYMVMFALLMIGVLGGIFTYLSFTICSALSAAGADWLYFTIMGLIAILLGAFGSVFNTYSGLYLSKDNDLLLSMPIPSNTIITARLLGVYIMGLMYSGIVIIPAAAVYIAAVDHSVFTVISCIIFVFLISLFVLTLSAVLGFVVAKISLKLKNKSFVTVAVSLVFFGLYYFFYFKAQTLITKLLENAAVYGDKIKGAAYLLYLFGRSATGDITALISVSAVILALFAAAWIIIAKSFLKIATATGKTAKKKYKETAVKQNGADTALFKKELKRFTSSPNYMLNCGFGLLFLILCGAAVVIKGGDISPAVSFLASVKDGLVPVIVCTAVCTLASMIDIAAPSVSLEGKSIWLPQSLPVTAWQVLRAKLFLQIALCLPAVLFCLICTVTVYRYTLPELLLTFLISVLYVILSALFGLFLSVKMPNLNWTNETTPIKQSASVAISLFGGFFYAALIIAGYFLLTKFIGYIVYMCLFAAVTALLSVLLYVYLKGKGAAEFAAL